ncbi:glycosyltransferase family 4 protein [Microbacterium sp. zg-Y818]|uniref:glycosyltransferase family 4 protein n=1 Tax=unclassified Microbacterium TaxID=2609290 RepID=UPI00214CBC59|nr:MULTISPECIES: glycosyltransferase family 4 protein [unclassified Microbacterium]MCR2802132.1 glycosyltransferase family 4 protein [Microbacterium sp. zg.Y818]WIM22678.1 glycosyltransferase family 4 protein [Microbacterium sp. zg-Y818]
MRQDVSAPSGSSGEKTLLTLLWVESTTDSTAAGAHLRGTLARLAPELFDLRVITRSTDGPSWLPGRLRKPWRIISVVGRAKLARPRGVLLARWSPFVALVSRRWTRRGRPLVLFVQGNLDDLYDSNPWTRRAPWLTNLALASIREATAVVTPSAGLAEWVGTVRGAGEQPTVTVIPNGVDLPLFESARKDADQVREPSAVFFGNMATWQGVDTILQALADPRWPADLALTVIGDGPLAREVADSVDPRVRYLGRRSKSEVAAVVAGAEMALATRSDVAASATGVSPFKVIEAAAAGTPAIVTRVPGQTELATDIGGAVLIAPGDPQALAQAVADLHADPELRARLTDRGLAGVRAYDWASRAGDLATVVTSVSASASRPTADATRLAGQRR